MSSSSDSINRRTFLQWSTGALAVASVPFLPAASLIDCDPTPDVVSGPFYPTGDRADEDVDLTRIEGRSDQAQGTYIRVRGRVLDEACEPVEGATVELWQADTNGRYRHERDTSSAPIDPGFQGWGEATTDEDGRYGFKTVKPAPYPTSPGSDDMRTPHIHFRTFHPDHHERVTQMFFEGEALNESDFIVQDLSKAERKSLILSPTPAEGVEEDVYVFNLTVVALRTDLISPDLLSRYAGTYQVEVYGETRTFQIAQDGERLYVNAPFISKRMELRPQSKTRFDTGGFVGEEIRFHPDEGPNGALTLAFGDERTVRGQKVGAKGEE